MTNSEIHGKNQKQVIYLLLNNKDLVGQWLQGNLKAKHFEEKYRPILEAITLCYDKGALLTTRTFHSFSRRFRPPKRLEMEIIYGGCYISKTSEDDYPMLMDEILKKYRQRKVTCAIKEYVNDVHSGGDNAEEILAANVQEIVLESLEENTVCEESAESAERYLQYVEGVRSGEIEEVPKVLCGIKEIDETMVTGFEPGTLTLFCAKVGGFKSWMLLNVAVNAWKNGYDVLFVPIEMSEEQTIKRKLSILTGVRNTRFYNYKDLTEEELKRTREEVASWRNRDNKFRILDLRGRSTVSQIRRHVKRDHDMFKPKLVVVDYLTIMQPEQSRYARHDLELGDICKEFRAMGKEMGFAVVSAAQQSRDSLKKKQAGKLQFGPEDIKGSHEVAADADNIYFIKEDKEFPNERLQMIVCKARNGTKKFPDGSYQTTLHIVEGTGRIITDEQSMYELCEVDGSDVKFDDAETEEGQDWSYSFDL